MVVSALTLVKGGACWSSRPRTSTSLTGIGRHQLAEARCTSLPATECATLAGTEATWVASTVVRSLLSRLALQCLGG